MATTKGNKPKRVRHQIDDSIWADLRLIINGLIKGHMYSRAGEKPPQSCRTLSSAIRKAATAFRKAEKTGEEIGAYVALTTHLRVIYEAYRKRHITENEYRMLLNEFLPKMVEPVLDDQVVKRATSRLFLTREEISSFDGPAGAANFMCETVFGISENTFRAHNKKSSRVVRHFVKQHDSAQDIEAFVMSGWSFLAVASEHVQAATILSKVLGFSEAAAEVAMRGLRSVREPMSKGREEKVNSILGAQLLARFLEKARHAPKS